jgi:TRAP-type C4-dicarboxylate transport system permease small subunit
MVAKLIRKLEALFDHILDISAVLSGVLIFLSMLGSSVDVMSRYILNEPIEPMIALTEFGLLYITFLAAGWLQRIDGHIKMDFIVSRMNSRNQLVFAIISSILAMIVSLFLIWYGAQVTRELWITKSYDVFKLQGVPKAIIVAIIPVGGLMLFLQLLRQILRQFKQRIEGCDAGPCLSNLEGHGGEIDR